MTETLFLKNNFGAYFRRILEVVFGFIWLLFGATAAQPYNWLWSILGIFQILFALIIDSKKYCYLKIINSNLLYKKSFFHKQIAIEPKSITNFLITDKKLIIDTASDQHKISLSEIREYDNNNLLPAFVKEIEKMINQRKQIVN